MPNKINQLLLYVCLMSGALASAQVQPYMNIITAKGVPNVVIVTPDVSDEVLVNPGMGFTTQSSVNGTVPGYPPSTVAYYRWYWDELEPQEGQFNWPMVDSVLARARAQGQRLATRIMPANGRPRVPDWYRKTGAKGFEYVAESTQLARQSTVSWMPDHQDPLYARYMGRLVREFARRYDGHPDIDQIDIGSYGHWGEWHLSFIKEKAEYPFEIKKMIIDWYLEGFKKTPLVICEDAEEGLVYATQHGTGWRADCMGDYGPPNHWNLMTRYLQLPYLYPSVGEAWKTRPVAFESCSTMEDWLAAGRDIEYIYSTCLALHTSILNNKSSPIPPEWWPATEKFLKRMGYRLVVRSLRHEKWLEPGGSLKIEMEIDNVGVAPPYRPYKPVFELRQTRGRDQKTVIMRQEADWKVLTCLPGRHQFSTTLALPANAGTGRYSVYFALLDPYTLLPTVKLAVTGRDAQGWYSWSALNIVGKGKLEETLSKTAGATSPAGNPLPPSPAPGPNAASDKTISANPAESDVWRTIKDFFQPPAEFANQFGSYRSPLMFKDGSKVVGPADWLRRRAEISREWNELMGAWPPVIEKPAMENLSEERRENITQRRVRIQIAPGQTGEGWLLLPETKGPAPAALVVYYEPETSVGLNPKQTQRDFGWQLARRGFVTLSIGTPGGNAWQPQIGTASCQPLSFHAYVAANCWQALASLPQVDPARIGVVGHSYGGKWAMFAAALWEKFACVAVSDPGIVFDESRPNVNYWEPWYLGLDAEHTRKPGVPDAENPRTGAYREMIERGRDLHEIHALLAPRPFLVSGGAEDPPLRWLALNHALAVNQLLGFTNRVAMTNREHHDPNERSNAQLYAFFEHFLKYKCRQP